MPKPIKVNIIDVIGKRTSTTISYAIAYFYCRHCGLLEQDLPLDKLLAQAVQNYINRHEECNTKFQVETMLLHESEVAIEKHLYKLYKPQQTDLFNVD